MLTHTDVTMNSLVGLAVVLQAVAVLTNGGFIVGKVSLGGFASGVCSLHMHVSRNYKRSK